MEIDVCLNREEVTALLAEAAPLRVHLSGVDEDRRFVELEPPSDVLFVPGQGVRIITRGRVRHEIAGVGLPFELRRVQVMFAPEVVSGPRGLRLQFPLRVEQADLENVPGLVEAVAVARVNQALDPEKLHLYWELAHSLSISVPLPERFEPLERFAGSARSAQVTVTHDSLLLRVHLGLSISRTRARPTNDP